MIFVTHDLNHAAQMDTVVYLTDKGGKCKVMNQEQFNAQLDELKGEIKGDE